jgi:hypothetical protein
MEDGQDLEKKEEGKKEKNINNVMRFVTQRELI